MIHAYATKQRKSIFDLIQEQEAKGINELADAIFNAKTVREDPRIGKVSMGVHRAFKDGSDYYYYVVGASKELTQVELDGNKLSVTATAKIGSETITYEYSTTVASDLKNPVVSLENGLLKVSFEKAETKQVLTIK